MAFGVLSYECPFWARSGIASLAIASLAIVSLAID